MGCSKTDITVWVNAIIHIIQFFIFVPLAGLGLRDANGFSDYSSTPLWQKLLIYICLIITSFVVVFGAFPIDETAKKRIVSIIVSIVSSILMIVFSIIFIIRMATFDFDWDSGDIQNRIEKEKEKKCCFIYSSLDIDSNEVTKSVVNEFSSLYYPLNDNHKNQKNRLLKSKKGGKGGDNSYIGDNSPYFMHKSLAISSVYPYFSSKEILVLSFLKDSSLFGSSIAIPTYCMQSSFMVS